MGHQINYTTIPVDYNKSQMKAEMDERAWHDHWQESSEGLPSDIRWIDFVCDNKDQAREYIEKHDSGWYDQLAVKFKQADYSKNKKIIALKERKNNVLRKKQSLDSVMHFKDTKSSLITCKGCGSKISNQYMQHRNTCPVCGFDMRSDTIKNRLKSYDDKIETLKDEIEKEQRIADQKGNLFWLVKTEYHC